MSENEFPLDDNGDVLRSMLSDGDDLKIPRDIDFQIVTPSEEAAEALANVVRSWGYAAKVEFPGCVPELPWEVHVVNRMLPTHEDITSFEERLGTAAATFDGRNDGWGCFHIKPN